MFDSLQRTMIIYTDARFFTLHLVLSSVEIVEEKNQLTLLSKI